MPLSRQTVARSVGKSCVELCKRRNALPSKQEGRKKNLVVVRRKTYVGMSMP